MNHGLDGPVKFSVDVLGDLGKRLRRVLGPKVVLGIKVVRLLLDFAVFGRLVI